MPIATDELFYTRETQFIIKYAFEDMLTGLSYRLQIRCNLSIILLSVLSLDIDLVIK